MSQALIDLQDSRARQARLGSKIGATGYKLLLVLAIGLGAGAIACGILLSVSVALLISGLAIAALLPAIWYKRHLSVLPPVGNTLTGRLSYDVLSRITSDADLQPQALLTALADHWHSRFIINHLLLSKDMVLEQLSMQPSDLDIALQHAVRLADANGSQLIEVVHVAGGLMIACPAISAMLIHYKAQAGDIEAVTNWLSQDLIEHQKASKNFGGIGRDWAFGFTPLLDRLGHNLSESIMRHNARFGSLTNSDGVRAIEAAFNNHASAVALIGPDGIGKSTTVQALARRLIEGNTGQALAYHQVVSLNATDITSNARGPRDLEDIMIRLTNEASHAGHVILFFDDAQLFMSDGAGAFDATHILLSIIQANAVPIILALSSSDYQRLRTQNQSLASALTPVVLQEPDETTVMHVLEDNAVGFEARHKVLIGYEALREAYRLSGRYEQDEAYPGKAIKLLERSIPYAEHGAVTTQSVQQAVEQTHGVKVATATAGEADTLLNLEELIHKRMINQTHAVSVVSNALRRARAGVTNPRRPIGSFLFLGPTGVGKTELAKAVAATFFGAESALIRLDMSEYQQPDDVQRLLSTGQNDANSLLLSVRQQPYAVVLFDEIEKAHPNVLNLFLQLLDEGQLTDSSGKSASFKDCVIIATSNAGANSIRERITAGQTLESFHDAFTDELIQSGQFKPELLNRFDEMVLFRPLNADELGQVVHLMLGEVNATLATQNITVVLTDAAIQIIVQQGNDPRLGARPMRRALQRVVEDTVAQKILRGQAQAGDTITLDAPDLQQ